MRIWKLSSSVLSTDRVASARQTRAQCPIVAVLALTGGLVPLLLRLLLLLLILLLGELLSPALIPSSEATEQSARRRPDRGALAGISGDRTADRAQRRTPGSTS